MPKILLADDTAELLASIHIALEELGHEVIDARNGADTVKRLAEKPPPDVVLLDIAMPGMDGLAVLRTLGPSAPPIIVMTGHGMDDSDFMEFPMVKRVLDKPLNLKDVVDAVNGVLAGNGAADERGC